MIREIKKKYVCVKGSPGNVDTINGGRIVNGTDATPGQFPFQVSSDTWLHLQTALQAISYACDVICKLTAFELHKV